jgi:hypothetical protein
VSAQLWARSELSDVGRGDRVRYYTNVDKALDLRSSGEPRWFRKQTIGLVAEVVKSETA